MKLRRIFFALTLVATAAVSLPSIARTETLQEQRMHDAALNATVYLPGAARVMHFRHGTATAPAELREGTSVIRGTTASTMDGFFPNTNARSSGRNAPDGAIIAHSSGTFSGNSVFTDVVAFQYRGGKVTRVAAHQVLGHVVNVEFAGDTLKVTYLTAGPSDPRCCPTVRKEMTLRYVRGRLRDVLP